MTGRYRAGIAGILFGLMAWGPARAQTADTVRVGQEADTTVVADSTAEVDTLQRAPDSSVVSSNDAGGDRTEPVVLRIMADSVVARLKNERVYEYANDPDYWKWKDKTEESPRSDRRSSTNNFLASQGFEYFILLLLGGILVYAIVRIILANRLQLFYRSPQRRMVVNPADGGLPDDDLDGQLTHYLQLKDYRQAVRYLYLKTLRILNDKGMIRYHQESTNQEYWLQLKATPQGPPFRDLTTIYEKVWYGEFPLGDTLFSRLHQYFEEFYKSVRA
jgi:hypothetical protein